MKRAQMGYRGKERETKRFAARTETFRLESWGEHEEQRGMPEQQIRV